MTRCCILFVCAHLLNPPSTLSQVHPRLPSFLILPHTLPTYHNSSEWQNFPIIHPSLCTYQDSLYIISELKHLGRKSDVLSSPPDLDWCTEQQQHEDITMPIWIRELITIVIMQ